jgi:Leucine-rich repeat (LRR) protein
LDGIHSASSCRSMVPIHVFNTIYASSQSVSSLPSCIYSLPNITSLHLSGNGITGSLPVDAFLNDGFIELVISNNEYRSIIPAAFQNHYWDVFDVSYNKFSGTLLPYLDISSSARLKINRISGAIPSSLYNTSEVAALTGNIFTCTNEELVRLHDEVQDRYVCGSSSFTNAGLLWFTLVILTITTIALSYMSQKSSVTKIIPSMVTLLHDIRTRFLSSSDLRV